MRTFVLWSFIYSVSIAAMFLIHIAIVPYPVKRERKLWHTVLDVSFLLTLAAWAAAVLWGPVSK